MIRKPPSTTSAAPVTVGAVGISAKIMKDRKATCYVAVKDDIENAGATYIDDEIVVDGNMISSPHYRDNPIWMKTVVEALENLR